MNRLFLAIILILAVSSSIKGQVFSSADFSLISSFHNQFKENHIDYERLSPVVEKRFPLEFVKLLDHGSSLFLESEFNDIRNSCPNFTELSKDHIDRFLEDTFKKVRLKLQERLSFLEHVAKQSFFEDDSILLDLGDSSIHFHQTKRDQEKYWVDLLKLEVLDRFYDDSVFMSIPDSEINNQLNSQLQQLIDNESCYVKDLLDAEKLKEHILSSTLQAYAQSFDPHSAYLSPQDERLFYASLSSEAYSLGLVVQRIGHSYLILEKNPSSSASQEEKINVGDEIISVNVSGTFISVGCISTDVLIESFYGVESDKVELQIKSSNDNKVRVFKLMKSYVENESNHTFSYILQNDSIKIGYVDFPSFYSNFDGYSRSSSEDMALILLEMRKRNPDGLIVDLRGNGGGSIQEAEELMGFFIDYGPLHILTNRNNKEGILYKDGKRGKLTEYNVIFIINSQSASASELLVSSLNMYPDILTVGNYSYGKATGQRGFPLQIPHEKENRGSALVTTIKIYDIGGNSYQGVGVRPDIVIPTGLGKNIIGENRYTYALENLPISKKFRAIKLKNEPVDSLRYKSQKRISSMDTFKKMRELESEVNRLFDSPFYQPLSFDKYSHSFPGFEDSDFEEKNQIFQVLTLEEDETFFSESNESKISIAKDPVLQETFKIFLDWISIK